LISVIWLDKNNALPRFGNFGDIGAFGFLIDGLALTTTRKACSLRPFLTISPPARAGSGGSRGFGISGRGSVKFFV